MKRHLRPCCPSAEGNTPSFYRSPVSLKLPMMLLCKGTCAPVVPLFERAGRKCLRHAPPFRRTWHHTNRVGIDVFSIRNISLIQTQHYYPDADLVSPEYIFSINQKYIQSKSSLRMAKKFISIGTLSIYAKVCTVCFHSACDEIHPKTSPSVVSDHDQPKETSCYWFGKHVHLVGIHVCVAVKNLKM